MNNSMETAPRNKTILLDVGLPWFVVGHYAPITDDWVYANINCGLYAGEYNDYYFENEHEKKPIGWLDIPEIQKSTNK